MTEAEERVRADQKRAKVSSGRALRRVVAQNEAGEGIGILTQWRPALLTGERAKDAAGSRSELARSKN